MPIECDQVSVIDGRLVRLERLCPDHASELFSSLSDPEVWRWKLVPQPASVEELRDLISEMTGPRRWPYLIRRRFDGVAIGSTTLARFDWIHGCVENGFTWLDRRSWGQGFNEETKLLLLRHVFRDLGFARVEWQCDAANRRSASALARLGFRHEGTLRSRHVRPDGSRRDSLVFGLVVGEWPAAHDRILELFEQRADPAMLAP